jgi:hypothetical protein
MAAVIKILTTEHQNLQYAGSGNKLSAAEILRIFEHHKEVHVANKDANEFRPATVFKTHETAQLQ